MELFFPHCFEESFLREYWPPLQMGLSPFRQNASWKSEGYLQEHFPRLITIWFSPPTEWFAFCCRGDDTRLRSLFIFPSRLSFLLFAKEVGIFLLKGPSPRCFSLYRFFPLNGSCSPRAVVVSFRATNASLLDLIPYERSLSPSNWRLTRRLSSPSPVSFLFSSPPGIDPYDKMAQCTVVELIRFFSIESELMVPPPPFSFYGKSSPPKSYPRQYAPSDFHTSFSPGLAPILKKISHFFLDKLAESSATITKA